MESRREHWEIRSEPEGMPFNTPDACQFERSANGHAMQLILACKKLPCVNHTCFLLLALNPRRPQEDRGNKEKIKEELEKEGIGKIMNLMQPLCVPKLTIVVAQRILHLWAEEALHPYALRTL